MEWIKCSDRMPAPNERIGFTFLANKQIRHDIWFNHDNKTWEENKCMDWDGEVETAITHWIPYPKPPEEE